MIFAEFTHPDNGYEGEGERALSKLTLGEKYIVKNVAVGRWHTGIQLQNVEGSFNSVLFDFYENDEKMDIRKYADEYKE